jgi:hypothetical protein
MPIPFEISLDDIADVGRLFDCDFSTAPQVAALLNRDSVDIQAAPGSGKTTLLVAKLAIMSRHWKSRTQGICVLSHTNVARLEVETRLARHPTGRQLLAYPHFIGTFQAFAHQFLALPYIRGKGIDPRMIDDDRFAAAARSCLKPWHVQNHLKRHQGSADKILTTLRYIGEDLQVGCAGNLPAAGTPTYEAFCTLKNRLTADGYLRFEDMFAYAQRAMRHVPQLADAVRTRFPCLFIDEMQDTDGLQEAFLRQAFGDSIVIQRFGDQNQAIFTESNIDANPANFPRPGFIDLARSRRFGDHIARAASALTINAPQAIEGDPRREPKAHTIFVFGDGAAESVIPAFGDLIFDQFPDGLPPKFVAKAIAGRKSGDGQDQPRHLGDYWPGFNATQTNRAASLPYLIDYARRARSCLAEHDECELAAKALWDGVLLLLHCGNVRLPNRRMITRSSVLAAMREADTVASLALQLEVRNLCFDADISTAQAWRTWTDALLASLSSLLPHPQNPAVRDFLSWNPDSAVARVAGGARQNVLTHMRGERAVDIELATVHGVKGETHNATLVLTTPSSRVFDLREAIGPLIGAPNARRLAMPTVARQLRIMFVALTRPSDLVCLAVPSNHISHPQRQMLAEQGWRVVDLPPIA